VGIPAGGPEGDKIKRSIHRRGAESVKKIFILFAGERPAIEKLRYPAGNYLAGGQGWFEQSLLSRDCSKKFSLRP
jgi:hypothetical protein